MMTEIVTTRILVITMQESRSDEDDIDSVDDDRQIYEGDAGEEEGEEENISNLCKPQDLVEFARHGRDKPVL